MTNSESSQPLERRRHFLRSTAWVIAVVLSAFLVGIFIVWTELPRPTPLWCATGHPSLSGLPDGLDPNYIRIVDASKLSPEVRTLYELALEGTLIGQPSNRFRDELLSARQMTHYGHDSKTHVRVVVIYEFCIHDAVAVGALDDGLHHLLTLQIVVCQQCGTIQRAYFLDYRF
ncbi:hypothetical protein [Rubinisphaera margarita]|uniref:hypothetical protein n=1 Tax=Rubinisphaera margarita TaxID=2909586 RepID=UPI001EE790D8|nr:hypothetical protein [Rubinisphaera margarita]MCG6154815.1 hypothetical protein [Rubinisphaera margarita]